MILVDANVFVGLLDEADPLHAAAIADARRLAGESWATVDAVLAESVYLLPGAHLRARLRDLLRRRSVGAAEQAVNADMRAIAFDWLLRYAEHDPDWADACLVVASGLLPGAKVWTYDREFSTIWRRPNGSRIPLAVH